jgi:hypothetical protein
VCSACWVRIVQASDDSWTYLANAVTVESVGVGSFRLRLTDAWSPASVARLLDEVECVCSAYTIERCAEQELAADSLLAEGTS